MLILLLAAIPGIMGHGLMLDPPNRSSLWRFDSSAPKNYDDNALWCGGFDVQYRLNNGQCGVCGDVYSAPHPQENENTGLYGQGIIARTYSAGSTITVEIWLTKSHLGDFTFSLCQLTNPNAPESGEDCFKPIKLADGSDKFQVRSDVGEHVWIDLKLPDGMRCDRCVLRWNYRAGNNWGDCGDGTGALGCGPQETFRSCSDIQIV